MQTVARQINRSLDTKCAGKSRWQHAVSVAAQYLPVSQCFQVAYGCVGAPGPLAGDSDCE
eukprot:722945-Rhodomonas_salina.2